MLCVVKPDPAPGVALDEKPEPRLQNATAVIVEVSACGICGSDISVYRSDKLIKYMEERGYGRTLGHEVSGVVCEIGPGVTGLKVGDRVACEPAHGCGNCFFCNRGQSNLCAERDGRLLGLSIDGGFARFVETDYRQLYRVPDSMSFEAAAILEPLGVSFRAFERSSLMPGDTAVVLGPGPLGFLGALVARSVGVHSIIVAGIAADTERLRMAEKMGFRSVVIEGDDLQKSVADMTRGIGADAVFDFAGGIGPLNLALEIVRKGGEIILVGGGASGELDPRLIQAREVTVTGSRARTPVTWARVIDLVRNGAVDPLSVLSDVMPLKDADAAFQRLIDRRALKICLAP